METLLFGSHAGNVRIKIKMAGRFTLYISLFAFLLASCSGASSVDEFKWMEGKWNGYPPDGRLITETWQKESDKLLLGLSCGLLGEDTVFKENPKIEIIEGTAFYITAFPDIKGSVLYRSTVAKPGHAVFENSELGFPAKI